MLYYHKMYSQFNFYDVFLQQVGMVKMEVGMDGIEVGTVGLKVKMEVGMAKMKV